MLVSRRSPSRSSAFRAARLVVVGTLLSATPLLSAAVAQQAGALLGRADSAWRAQAIPLATQLYQSIVERDSSASSLAVFRLATLRAWDNRLPEAVALHRRYVALEPRDTEGRLALARALAWSGQYDGAIAIFDSVVVSDSTYRDAVIGRAQALVWAGRFDEALPSYRRWLALHPTDRDAALAYARALAWDGQLADAEALYTRLAVGTDDADASKGLARVIGWRGELSRSELAWRAVVAAHPTDPEALTGLAQVLRWQGRPADASSALDAALAARPGYGDALALRRWVDADLRPSVGTTVSGNTDSDANRAETAVVDYSARAPWNGTMSVVATERRATFADLVSHAHAVGVATTWSPTASPWTLRADAGVTRHESRNGAIASVGATLVNVGARAWGPLSSAVSAGFGASRAPFDETAALIANSVVTSTIDGDVDIQLPARFTLSATGGHTRLTGGTRDNGRTAASAVLRWTQSRPWSYAVGVRSFAYDTSSVDGYFAPRRYTLTELSARARRGGDLGWNGSVDAGVGQQHIEFFTGDGSSRLAERLAATAGYRFDPAHEVSGTISSANVASPGQATRGEYSATTLVLRARIGL